MYLDSSPEARRRTAATARRRGTCHQPVSQSAVAIAAPALPPRPDTAAARRTRLDDAIVAQWLLDQLPSEHRHART
jgi:hypothetical protein